jgi:CheY-like chemotaxis protein
MEDAGRFEYKRLLLVGDELYSMFLILTYLESCGYGIASAPDGQAALQFLQERTPDLIVYCEDDNAPVDGYAFLRQVRQVSSTRHTPLILISSRNQTVEQIKALNPKTEAYLLRPFEPEDLKMLVQSLIQKCAFWSGWEFGQKKFWELPKCFPENPSKLFTPNRLCTDQP